MKKFYLILNALLLASLTTFAQPAITTITSPTSDLDVKSLGEIVEIVVHFDDTVEITGTPALTLNSGSSVNYTSGDGTQDIVFQYTVGSGDYSTALDVTALTGGTIGIISGDDDAIRTLPVPAGDKLSGSSTFLVDARVRTIQNVTTTTVNGTYKAGEVILITVNYNYSVNVVGSPILMLNTDNAGVYATYNSGSGTTGLIFKYTVAQGDNTTTLTQLDYKATNSLNPNGASMQDPGGNDVSIVLPALDGGSSLTGIANAKAIIIDAQSPTVLSVSATSGSVSPLMIGESVTITVTFSEPVVITAPLPADKPNLLLETGLNDTVAVGAAGASSGTHSFSYTVRNGDESADLNYKSISALTIGGAGTILDAVGNTANLTLPALDSANSLAGTSAFVIDGIKPTVTKVTSSNINGTYNATDILSIQVIFDDAVTVTGTPTLDLATGGGATNLATYVTAAANDTLTFTYTVQSDENTTDLDYVAVGSLALAGGSIKDANDNDATLTLMTPGTSGSLGSSKAIVLDNDAPVVDSIKSTAANGTYNIGDKIFITVYFNEKVKTTGKPRIALNCGGSDSVAYYYSGTGNTSLTFLYTVLEGHESSDLDVKDAVTVIDLNGGTLTDIAGNSTAYALPVPGALNSISDNQAIIIDGMKPNVLDIYSTFVSPANAGDSIVISVVFSTPVVVTGIPKILLETGKTDRYANYSTTGGGSGNDTLNFGYKVQVGDTTSVLEIKSINALSGGTIKDVSGNDAILTLTLGQLAGDAIVVDAMTPVVRNITSSKANGTYKFISGNAVNNKVEILVIFNDVVDVVGAPTLALPVGLTGPAVFDVSSTGNDTLKFVYTIASGDNIADLDYLATDITTTPGFPIYALTDGTSITDANGNSVAEANGTIKIPAPGASGSIGKNKAIVIDNTAATSPIVSSTTVEGTYILGKTIYVTATYNEVVYVTGKPRILLETGTTDQYATYYSGSGQKKLSFKYVVQAGDYTLKLNYIAGNIDTTGATIKDKAGNDATLLLPAPSANGILDNAAKIIKIDGVQPSVSSLTAAVTTGTAPANAGEVVTISVVFDGSVVVTNTPKIQLETGSVDRYANYVSGSGTTTLLFDYTVMAGDATDTLKVKSATALSGAIKDTSGNSGVLTLFTSGVNSLVPSAVKVDAIVPVVKKVTSTNANGYYKVGQAINIRVQFSEEMAVSAGVGDHKITLGSGIGTPLITNGALSVPLNESILEFTYTVATDDQNIDLNYLATNALSTSGTIQDKNGNTANLTLPVLTSSNSLAGNKNLYVDAKDPDFSSITSQNAPGNYYIGNTIYIKVTFSEKVKVSGKPYINLNNTGVATYSSGSSSNVLQFKYTVAAGQAIGTLDYSGAIKLGTGSIKDFAGNIADSVLTGTGLSSKGFIINTTTGKSSEISVTDIQDNSNTAEFNISVYPNPITDGKIAVYFNGNTDNKEVGIQIYDILGNSVYNEKNTVTDKIVIEQKLEAGVYIINVVNNGQVFNQNIIVQ